MTIKEKAEEYRRDTFGTQFGRDIAMAFSEGSEWMLEKAIEWLKNQGAKSNNGVVMISIDDFKKAMEE